ncbi:MAG: hypothetical protein AAB250_10445 [Bdellovibrionota bacterium]
MVVDNRVSFEEYEILRNSISHLLPASAVGESDAFLADHIEKRSKQGGASTDVSEIPPWVLDRVRGILRKRAEADLSKGLDHAIESKSAYTLALLIGERIDRGTETTQATRDAIAKDLASPEAQVRSFGDTAVWVLKQYAELGLDFRQLSALAKAATTLSPDVIRQLAKVDPAFSSEEARVILKSIARKKNRAEIVIEPFHGGMGGLQLSKVWTAYDSLFLKVLETAPELPKYYADRIARWLDRVKDIGPERISEHVVEKVFRHAVADHADGGSASSTDALIRTLVFLVELPGVERMGIAHEIADLAVTQKDNPYFKDFGYHHDRLLRRMKKALDLRWSRDPRYGIWKQALELEARHRAAFLQGMKTPTTCEGMFR